MDILQKDNLFPHEEHKMRGSGAVYFYNDFFLYRSQIGKKYTIKFTYQIPKKDTPIQFEEFVKFLSYKKDMGTNGFSYDAVDKHKDWLKQGLGEVIEGEI